ncbi:hypothetical protein VTN02DRAFT_879 [Thermoascus thermophilus]
MDRLPVELLSKIIDYLTPREQVRLQLVSKQFLALARDNNRWRLHCYESSWSAAGSPFLVGTVSESLHVSDVTPLSTLGQRELRYLIQPRALAHNGGHNGGADGPDASSSRKRAKAAADWDPSYEKEDVDWYSDYIARNGPISFSWLQKPYTVHGRSRKREPCEVKGMGLFRDWSAGRENKVIAPLENGSVCIWDLRNSYHDEPQATKGKIVATSAPGILLADMSRRHEMSPSKSQDLEFVNVGECVSVDSISRRVYIAVGNILNEVDLETLKVISQQRYPWSIFAMSQETDYSAPLTVATTLSLQIYDSRLSLPEAEADMSLRCEKESGLILESHPYSSSDSPPFQLQPNSQHAHRMRSPDPSHPSDNYAPLFQPGPLSILHPPAPHFNTILLAGRFPSILSYDRRFFPQLQHTIHSGARLSGLASAPAPRFPDSSGSALLDSHSIIACGEYNGKGSLELYNLASSTCDSHDGVSSPCSYLSAIYQNRQSAARSKLLSVASHGTRIVYSDAEGNVKWVERDGRSEVRRWNINTDAQYTAYTRHQQDQYSPASSPDEVWSVGSSQSTSITGEAVRKILPTGLSLTGDELLLWTGDRVGRITFSERTCSEADEDEDDILSDEEPDQVLREEKRRSRKEEQQREREYAMMMRRALERQADEVRWMGRLGMG